MTGPKSTAHERKKWREYKKKWRAENPEKNREINRRYFRKKRLEERLAKEESPREG